MIYSVSSQEEGPDPAPPADETAQSAEVPASEAHAQPRAPGAPLPSQRLAAAAKARVAADSAEPVRCWREHASTTKSLDA